MLNYSGRQKKILIVDDEATLAFFLKQSLQDERPDYAVDIASSGEDAITRLNYDQYDLLITDLKMPGISGFTLIEVARTLQPTIKIILMTAYGSTELEQLAVEAYLTKPFTTAYLRDLARKFLAPDNLIGEPPRN